MPNESLPPVFHPIGLSETVQLGERQVTISTDPDRLKLDFLTEAKRREGIDPDKAEELAKNLSIFFRRDELYRHIADSFGSKEKVLWRAIGQATKIALPLATLFQGDPLGSTFDKSDGPAIYLSPSMLVNYSLPANDVNGNVSDEVKEMAIRQIVYESWRHEREHLIRSLSPKERTVDTKINLAKNATAGISSGLMLFFVYHFKPEVPSHGDPAIETLNNVRFIITMATSFLGSQLLSQYIWYYRRNPSEKAGREQGKEGHNLPNLFEFQFEKISA